jgi:hypothetical protein
MIEYLKTAVNEGDEGWPESILAPSEGNGGWNRPEILLRAAAARGLKVSLLFYPWKALDARESTQSVFAMQLDKYILHTLEELGYEMLEELPWADKGQQVGHSAVEEAVDAILYLTSVLGILEANVPYGHGLEEGARASYDPGTFLPSRAGRYALVSKAVSSVISIRTFFPCRKWHKMDPSQKHWDEDTLSNAVIAARDRAVVALGDSIGVLMSVRERADYPQKMKWEAVAGLTASKTNATRALRGVRIGPGEHGVE